MNADFFGNLPATTPPGRDRSTRGLIFSLTHGARFTRRLLLILVVVGLGQCLAASPEVPPADWGSYRVAKRLMLAKRPDSVFTITEPILAELKLAGDLATTFGFHIRLVHVFALIQSDKETATYDYLWQLRDDSYAAGQWSVYAESCRGIVLLMERTGDTEVSYRHLRLAQQTIREHGIDSIFPALGVRLATHHRFFGTRDSAFYYAREVLRTAPLYGEDFKTADGHLLLGLLYYQEQLDSSIHHLRQSAQRYGLLGDKPMAASMYAQLAQAYAATGRPQTALTYVDSSLHYAYQFDFRQAERLGRAFNSKATAFQELNMLDSTTYYLRLANQYNLRAAEQDKKVEFAAVNRKYAVEKSKAALEGERALNRILLLALVLLLLLVATAGWYYLRLRQANGVIRQQNQQLRSHDAHKSRFFANISHELRTPLTLIAGPLSSLTNRKDLPPDAQRFLGLINRGASNLQLLIDEILDLNKLASGKLTVTRKPTALAIFWGQYLAQFASLATFKDIEFVRDVSLGDLVVNLDRKKCQHIVGNLLSNAFKFTPANGKVTATVRAEDSHLTISIEDTGRGIHPDDIPYIFERYFQTRQPGANLTGGTGIGLSLSRELTQLLGGTLSVTSTYGGGTVFHLRLPLYPTTEPAETKEEPGFPVLLPDAEAKTVVSSVSRPTVLVVEDNPELQDYLRLVLSTDFTVLTANDGRQALKQLPEDGAAIDLLITDLMMPEMDGYELTKTLKDSERWQHLPTLVLTARGGRDDRLRALRIGVDDYLTKPFDEQELTVRVHNLLKNRSARQTSEAEALTASEPIPKSFQEQQLQMIEQHVRLRIADNELTVASLARASNMSESKLLRFLKRTTGLTTKKFITEIRLLEARTLLADRKLASVTAVAFAVGYGDARTFTRAFKTRYGALPSVFHNELTTNDSQNPAT